jgi:AAA domain
MGVSIVDIEGSLISKIIETGDLKPAFEAKVRQDFFEDPLHREVFGFLAEYFERFGKTPSAETLLHEFPRFHLTPTEEPYEYYIEKANHRRQYNLLIDVFEPFRDALEAHDSAKAIKALREGLLEVEASWIHSLGMELLNEDDLLSLEPPKQLVDGVLTRDSLSVLTGQPGSFKTFLALDLALCVETGRPWCGHRCGPGKVLYVVAEGLSGLASRVRAWKAARGENRPLRDITWTRAGVDLLNPESTDDLVGLIRGLEPDLVVIDTLGRCMVGGKENEFETMSVVVAACDRLREVCGSAVLIIHHDTKGGEPVRGHSAVQGAVETVISTTKDKKTGLVTVKPAKPHRDLGAFPTLHLKPAAVNDSLVLEEAQVDEYVGLGDDEEQDPGRGLLAFVRQRWPQDPVHQAVVVSAAVEHLRMSQTGVRRAIKELVGHGYLAVEGPKNKRSIRVT